MALGLSESGKNVVADYLGLESKFLSLFSKATGSTFPESERSALRNMLKDGKNDDKFGDENTAQ